MTPAGDLYLVEVRKSSPGGDVHPLPALPTVAGTEVLRVSTPTFGFCWLVPRLKGWRLRHPQIPGPVQRTGTGRVAARQGRHGVLLRRGSRPGTESLKLFSEELIPVCAPENLPASLHRPHATEQPGAAAKRLAPQGWHDWFADGGFTPSTAITGRVSTRSICAFGRRRWAVAWRYYRASWWRRNWPMASW